MEEVTKNKKITVNKTLSLRIVKPTEVEWDEFADLVGQLRRMIVPLYNSAVSKLYEHLQNPQTRLRRGNEKPIVQQWMTERVYRPVYETVYNSYIALGVKIKLEANFTGKKVWDIKYGKSAPPYVLSTTFPLVFNVQDGIKMENDKDEFLINIPFPTYEKMIPVLNELDTFSEKNKEIISKYENFSENQVGDILLKSEEVGEKNQKSIASFFNLLDGIKTHKYEPWRKFVFKKTGTTQNIQLLLSTKNRKKRGDWVNDESTEAEIKKVMDGTYKVTTLEIIQKDKNWFVHISIKYEKEVGELDKKKIVGIHAGIARPLTCVIRKEKYKFLSIHPNTVIALTNKQLARLREQRMGNKYRKGGHGIHHKLAVTDNRAVDYREKRKKVIEQWVSRVVDFCVNNNIGTVHMEETASDNSFLAKFKYPVAEILSRIENKLKQEGIVVKKQKPYYVNQICSKCGHYNKGFTYLFRKKNKFPKFKCEDCLETMPTEINAASNIANPDFEKILKKFALLKSI